MNKGNDYVEFEPCDVEYLAGKKAIDFIKKNFSKYGRVLEYDSDALLMVGVKPEMKGNKTVYVACIWIDPMIYTATGLMARLMSQARENLRKKGWKIYQVYENEGGVRLGTPFI